MQEGRTYAVILGRLRYWLPQLQAPNYGVGFVAAKVQHLSGANATPGPEVVAVKIFTLAHGRLTKTLFNQG